MHLSPFDSAVRDCLLWATNNLFDAWMSRRDASHQAIGRIYNLSENTAEQRGLSGHANPRDHLLLHHSSWS
jgi:hypothetical protein